MKITSIYLCCGLALLGQASYADTATSHFFGDWGGARSDLAAKGIDIQAYHIFDVYDDFSGAAESGTAYFGRQRVALDFDLEQLLGWEASYLSISGVYQYGQNYNRSRFGVFTNPSSIEGNETTRLANIYFGQSLFDGRLHYKIGKVDGVGEFGAQEYGSTFMNDEFAYVPNALFTSGLPFDPAQKLGMVVTYSPFGQGIYLKGGIYDSNNLDAYDDDDHGFSFDWQGAVAYAAEIGYRSDPKTTSRPGFIKLGTHYNTDTAAHYLNGESSGHNYLIYLSAGQTLFNFSSEGDRHLDASLTWVHAPENRNLYANEFTAMLRAVGPFAGRPHDELGLGLVAALISDDFSEASKLGGGPASSEEYTVELTYKAAITPWLDLQPSLQAVVNPAGDTSRDTVWIAGLRTVLTF
jgi:porin